MSDPPPWGAGVATVPSASPPAPRLLLFLAWCVVGAALPIGLLAAFTPLVLLTPLLGAPIVLLLKRGGASNTELFGLPAGLAVPLLYIGYLNRGGPGDVCTHTSGGTDCASESSPWPWLAASTVLLVVGVAGFVVQWRRRR
jgi:hypothetical protein